MEIQTKVRVKQWGNSLGIVIPREIVIKEELEPEEEVIVTIRKKDTLSTLFGKGKGIKLDAQKMKDELRREWSR